MLPIRLNYCISNFFIVKLGYNEIYGTVSTLVRFSREFNITVIVKTEFDYFTKSEARYQEMTTASLVGLIPGRVSKSTWL